MFFLNRMMRRGLVGDKLLAAEGLVIAVCDESSPFKRPSIGNDAWASTTPDSDMRLFEYNGYMAERMAAEQAIIWILLLWGMFRLRVTLHRRIDQMPPLQSNCSLIGNGQEATINMPTGRLGWIDVEVSARVGWRTIAVVPPGRYLGRLSGEEQPSHWDITNPAEYPPNDEDWTLHLAPLGPAVSFK